MFYLLFSLQTDIYEVCPQPLVLAQQLTHIELERLSMIGPEEFVQVFVKETEKDVSHLSCTFGLGFVSSKKKSIQISICLMYCLIYSLLIFLFSEYLQRCEKNQQL